MTPVGWWHDLSGGEIAANRPPPPGADLPYPHIYSIPPKPVLPSTSFRDTVETRLVQERDDTERLAAHTPIVVEAVPPPPAPTPPAPSPQSAQAPGTEAAEPTTANATLPAADAAPAPAQPAPQPHQAVATAPDGGPALGSTLVMAGLPPEAAELPNVPDAPPPPATFEGIPAQPAPSRPPPLPAHTSPAAQGVAVFFAPGSADLDTSQDITIKDVASHVGHGAVEVEGHGGAASDTPSGQAAAIALGLQRAQAVAKELQLQHVPASAIRISATAFGLGASLRLSS